MVKTKIPLLSFEAHGTIAKEITFQRRDGATFSRQTPAPRDAKTLPQIYHRWDYIHYLHLWTLLSPAVKQTWLTNASRYHMTGLNLYLKTHVKHLTDMSLRLHLDRQIGSYTYDSSLNSRHATIYGAVPCPGRISTAFHFDGLDDYLSIPLTALSGAELTFLWWAKANWSALPISQCRCLSTDHSLGSNYEFRTYNNNPLQFYWGDSTDAWAVSLGKPADNVWTHFTATFKWDGSNTTTRGYQNGDFVEQVVKASRFQLPDLAFDIGKWNSSFFLGDIDEFTVFTTILPDTLIKLYSERRYPS